MINRYTPFFLLLFVGVLFYSASFTNEFTYDDKMVLVHNHYVQDIENLYRLFTSDYFLVSSERTFRPIAPLVLFLEHALFGLKPFMYHVVNFLLHFANACLIFILLLRLKHRGLSAFIASILFFLHPALSETVFCMSYMEDLWGLLFYLIGLLLFLKYLSSGKTLFAVLIQVFFFLSLLSKEMGISYLVVLPLLMKLYYNRKIFSAKYLKTIFVPSVITISVYLWLRFFVYFQQAKTANYSGGGLWSTLINIPRIFLFYIKLLFYPTNLVADYNFQMYDSVFTGSVIFSAVMVLSILILLFRLKRKSLFWSLFFIINFIPISNIIPFGAVVAERYIYFSAVGFAVLVGLGFGGQIEKNRLISLVGLVLVILSYGIILLPRGDDWKSDDSLWLATERKAPAQYTGKATYHLNLGSVYFHRGDYETALKEYEIARRLQPEILGIYTNMGIIYMNQGHDEVAKSQFLKAISMRKDHPEGYYRLSVLYEKQGKYDEAEKMIREVINLDDNSLRGLFQLAQISVKRGHSSEAIECYKRILSIDKKSKQAYSQLAWLYVDDDRYAQAYKCLNVGLRELKRDSHLRIVLAQVYIAEGKDVDALVELDKVIGVEPENRSAYPIRASVFYKMRKFDLAEDDLKKSIQLNPGEVRYLNNLASIYADAGKFGLAKKLWRESLKLNPDQPRIKNYLAE